MCHERSNLARLPVGSLPTYGTAYPVAMVSPLKIHRTHFKSDASASLLVMQSARAASILQAN